MSIALPVRGRLAPLAQGLVGGQAGRLPQGPRTRGQHVRGQSERRARGHVQRQQGVHAPCVIERAPAADGMTVAPQPRGHLLACWGVPARQEGEHLEPCLLTTVVGLLSMRLEALYFCGKNRDGLAHRLLSWGADAISLPCEQIYAPFAIQRHIKLSMTG